MHFKLNRAIRKYLNFRDNMNAQFLSYHLLSESEKHSDYIIHKIIRQFLIKRYCNITRACPGIWSIYDLLFADFNCRSVELLVFSV